jgi:hypothetical protein
VNAGSLAGTPVAVTTFQATQTRLVVASSADAACRATSMSSAAPTGTGATLTVFLPSNFAGMTGASSNAHLTTWKDGAIVVNDETATVGTVMLTLQQPDGGTMGTYDITFPSGHEQGSFVAPACDICVSKP